jgi:hypothetical protein
MDCTMLVERAEQHRHKAIQKLYPKTHELGRKQGQEKKSIDMCD